VGEGLSEVVETRVRRGGGEAAVGDQRLDGSGGDEPGDLVEPSD